MNKIKLGILCPSEIAFRRFLPSLERCKDSFEYVGVACASESEWFGTLPSKELINAEREKAKNICEGFGGAIYTSYTEMLNSDIDAVYIPLPPALHVKWGMTALERGKHVLMEKPFATKIDDANRLISLAKEKELAVYENYMFQFHRQLEIISKLISDGEVGELRLIRIAFGFPFRGVNDFRYDKALGGGALLDCGGYTLKLASLFLGDSARVTTSNLNSKDGFDVDIYGSGTMVNDDGLTAQLAFGMDNSYKCDLEIWGSIGTIKASRILTAPPDFEPEVIICTQAGEKVIQVPKDDQFLKSIQRFKKLITDKRDREEEYEVLLNQMRLLDAVLKYN